MRFLGFALSSRLPAVSPSLPRRETRAFAAVRSHNRSRGPPQYLRIEAEPHLARSQSLCLSRSTAAARPKAPKMAALSLSQSGQGKSDFTLDQARELASDLGFVKPDVPHSAPIIKRVDMDKFFKAYGVNSLSAFKKSFAEESLPQPGTAEFEVYATQKSAAKAAAAKGKKGGMNADGELVRERRRRTALPFRPGAEAKADAQRKRKRQKPCSGAIHGQVAHLCPSLMMHAVLLYVRAGAGADRPDSVRAHSLLALRGALRELGGA